MQFYEIDNALQEAIISADKLVRINIDIYLDDEVISIFDTDIVEAQFFGLKEAAGGTSAKGEVTINNIQLTGDKERCAGHEVRVLFSLGDGLPYFQRFVFYIDEKGIQDVRGSGTRQTHENFLRAKSLKKS